MWRRTTIVVVVSVVFQTTLVRVVSCFLAVATGDVAAASVGFVTSFVALGAFWCSVTVIKIMIVLFAPSTKEFL